MIILRSFIFVFFILLRINFTLSEDKLKQFVINGEAQGTSFNITYFANNDLFIHKSIDSIFNEIDNSLSIYKPNTLINRFNESHSGIEMDVHLKNIVIRSLELFEESDGIFDITSYPLIELWGFGNKSISSFPNSKIIDSALAVVGSDKLKITGNRLVKTNPFIKINVNAIAPGYTSDLIASFLEKHNIENYIVDVGGEIRVKGRKPDGSKMSIGIEAPVDNSNDESSITRIIQIDSGAITTAGVFRQYHESGFKRIPHLLNAKTGYPIQNNLLSVTVIAKNALTADGYDNVLMGLGLDKSLKFLNNKRDLEAYFIYRKSDGSITDTATVGFYKLLK